MNVPQEFRADSKIAVENAVNEEWESSEVRTGIYRDAGQRYQSGEIETVLQDSGYQRDEKNIRGHVEIGFEKMSFDVPNGNQTAANGCQHTECNSCHSERFIRDGMK